MATKSQNKTTTVLVVDPRENMANAAEQAAAGGSDAQQAEVVNQDSTQDDYEQAETNIAEEIHRQESEMPEQHSAEDDGKTENTGTDQAPKQETDTDAYSEFGGVGSESQRMYKDLVKQYDENRNARLALAEQLLKPKDRTPEYKRQRNVALGQAIGQALGAIFSGAISSGGIGKMGYGHVALPDDLASKSYADALKQKELGVQEQQEYDKLLYGITADLNDDGLKLAEQRYKDTVARENLNERLNATAEANRQKMEFNAEQNELNRESNERVAKARANASVQVARERAAASGKGGNEKLSPLEAMFLPDTETKKTTNEYDQTKITESRPTKYNDKDISAAKQKAEEIRRSLKTAFPNQTFSDDDIAYVQAYFIDSGWYTWEELIKAMNQNRDLYWSQLVNLASDPSRTNEKPVSERDSDNALPQLSSVLKQ